MNISGLKGVDFLEEKAKLDNPKSYDGFCTDKV